MPTKYEIHEYCIIEAFSEAYPDSRIRLELLRSLRGRGAFRRFKDVLQSHSIEQAWYDWRGNAYREIAVRWCVEHQLEYTE
ncbi:MAG: hypothetical protein J6I45_02730 [Clostridia bacterium]|nr:hypothetical protein [Clostridia bacterium]